MLQLLLQLDFLLPPSPLFTLHSPLSSNTAAAAAAERADDVSAADACSAVLLSERRVAGESSTQQHRSSGIESPVLRCDRHSLLYLRSFLQAILQGRTPLTELRPVTIPAT